MNAYLEYDPDVFRDKVILLPCDDPEWSNFAKFFALHFMDFGLKKLISTSYAPDSNPAAAQLPADALRDRETRSSTRPRPTPTARSSSWSPTTSTATASSTSTTSSGSTSRATATSAAPR